MEKATIKILDTNVLLEVIRGNSTVLKHLKIYDPSHLTTTSINIYEFYLGAYLDVKKVAKRISDVKKIEDSIKILEFDRTAGKHSAYICSDLLKRHIIKSKSDWLADVLIAGMAKRYNAAVITFDSDFDQMHDIIVEKLHWK